jgi:hypothetical protein
MDHAASLLERAVIIRPITTPALNRLVYNAIKLLRNPPIKKRRGMRG